LYLTVNITWLGAGRNRITRQKNDPFKKIEDAREVSALVGVRAAALWP
jgi:hypothetical protein